MLASPASRGGEGVERGCVTGKGWRECVLIGDIERVCDGGRC